MKKFLYITIICLLFSTGCVETIHNKLKPQEDQVPIIKTLGTEHTKAALAMAEAKDLKQEQSNGLGLIRNDAFEEYANHILDQLKQASGVENLPGRVYLKAVNAWSAKATASGNIFVPIGILGDINSEDVFAALLAHELSHVIQNHADADLIVKVTKKSVYAISLINGVSGKEIADSDAFRGAIGSFAASEIFLCPFWSRSQEMEADCLGLDILIAAGYSPNAMEDLLKILEVLDERNRIERERKLMLIREASQKTQNEAIRNLDLDTCFKSVLSDATGALKNMIGSFMDTHDSAGERIDNLRGYKKTHYRRTPRKTYETRQWQAAINTPKMAQAVRGVEYTYLAHEHLVKRELDQALTDIRRAISQETKNENYIRTVFADIRNAQGKTNYYLKNHEIALKGKYPSFDSYKAVISSRINQSKKQRSKSKNFDELISVFEDYGRPPQYYKELVTFAKQLDFKEKAVALEIECMAKYAGDGISCSNKQSEAGNTLSAKSFLDALSPPVP